MIQTRAKPGCGGAICPADCATLGPTASAVELGVELARTAIPAPIAKSAPRHNKRLAMFLTYVFIRRERCGILSVAAAFSRVEVAATLGSTCSRAAPTCRSVESQQRRVGSKLIWHRAVDRPRGYYA